MNSKQMLRKGTLLALTASIIWGISGTVMQFVAQSTSVPATWFIGTRTLITGIILLLIVFFKNGKQQFFRIFKNKKSVVLLILFSLLGLLGNLYTFFYSVQLGNSAAATILQYLSPLFILLGTLIFMHKIPSKVDLISFGIALIGVFLLITQGNIHHLVIPFAAFIWGVLSGLTAAFYVVFPKLLVEMDFDPVEVTGWGMFLSGVISQFIRPIWQLPPHFTLSAAMGVGTIILLGTLLAFLIMITATKYVSSAIVSITDAAQPFVTFILSIIFLQAHFSLAEVIGACLVVISIYILNRFSEE